MKVYELIEQLKELPQEDEIVITAQDDRFYCGNFEIHSKYDDGQAQEIILPYFIEEYYECE